MPGIEIATRDNLKLCGDRVEFIIITCFQMGKRCLKAEQGTIQHAVFV